MKRSRICAAALVMFALASCSPHVTRHPAGHGSHMPAASHAPERPLHSMSAYGDTVWLGSTRPERAVVIARGEDQMHAAPRPGLAVYGRSLGTPLAIRVPLRLRERTARQIVEGVLAREDLHLLWWDDPDPDSLATQEAGHFDDDGGRPLFGFDLGFPLEKAHGYRVLIVVLGRADTYSRFSHPVNGREPWALRRKPEDPTPILPGTAVRVFTVTHGDRLATVRVVADYDVDLDAMRVSAHPAAPGTVRRWAAKALR